MLHIKLLFNIKHVKRYATIYIFSQQGHRKWASHLVPGSSAWQANALTFFGYFSITVLEEDLEV